MADTNFVVERENSGTEELTSNWDSGWQESEWIRKIRSGLSRSGQNTGGDVPIKKVPASLRKFVELYTPRQWQFGLHNRDPQASTSESEVLKTSLAAACKLNKDNWDKFCADFVDNPADMLLKSYGIYTSVTELCPKDVQYLLTLDALTLVLILSSFSIPESGQAQGLPNLFIGSLVAGGFKIETLVKYGAAYCMIWEDIFLCENQIPMALIKKAISKCYGLLPEERKSNHCPALLELENPDSHVTKELLDTILKFVAFVWCRKVFAEPFPDKKNNLFELIDVNYEVGELENCAHVFACIHKVMTSCVNSTTADRKSAATDTEVFAPDVNQQLETDVEALETVGTPTIAVTTTFGRAKQFFLRAVATSSKQLASVIATIFGSSRETATEEVFAFFQVIKSATHLKKAGLQIQGIPGMVQQVAFKNGCLFLPIMSQTESIESYICNMAAYEIWSTSAPFRFMDYLLLMSQLIKTPEDVSYLVDCNVLRTYSGTKQSTFQMWERLQSVVLHASYSDEYRECIVKPINRHRGYRFKPLLTIGLISGFIALVATFIQTYVLVIGSDKMQPHFPRGG